MGVEGVRGQFANNGSLWRIDADGSIHQVISNVELSIGFCWDVKEKAFYYADSLKNVIWRYDYDIDTGIICKYFLNNVINM